MLNPAADSFVQEIKNFCSNKFKQPEDVERLIKISLQNNKKELLEETAFYSKYLQGLLTIIQRGETSITEEVFTRYRNEYLQNIEKIKANLQKIILGSDDFYKNIFADKYLTISESSVKNLVDLIHDLSWIKMYLNSSRHK